MRAHSFARTALHFSLIAAFCSGCIKNPALGLTANDVDPVVEETYKDRATGLYRGDDKVDEQDFYAIVGDIDSAKQIKAARSSGETKQTVGGVLIGVGAAVLAGTLALYILPKGGVLGDKGLFDPPSPYLNYAGLLLGLGGTAGGLVLLRNGKEATSGKTLMFPLKHAQESLEKAQYGGAGLQPENIKSLMLTAIKGRSSYCGNSGIDLEPLVGKDEKGREIKLARHEDWLEWETDPEGLMVEAKSHSDTAQSARGIRSPMRKDLKALGKQVKITVTVKGTSTTASLLLSQDLSCPEDAFYSGSGGSSGSSGSSGSYGSSGGGSGGDGQDGGDGGDGDNGVDVDVEAAWVKDKSGHRYALIAAKSAQGKPVVVLMEKGAEFSVVSAGGPGGSGGWGGSGGSGASSDGGSTPKYCAGDGGRGGNGGRGGRGGNGGRIVIKATDKALFDQIPAGAPGGSAGSGGSSGSGGSHGSESSPCSGAKNGPSGASGASGNSGRDGSVKKQQASAGELSMIQAVLREAPNLSLDK